MSQKKCSISKITPLVPGKVVLRDRLFAIFDQPLPTSSFWVSGPGGSGKSTLISSYLEQRNIQCLWYQVDSLDSDPSTFFYYLGLAAKPLIHSTDISLPLLTPEYLPDIDIFTTRYFESFFQHLDAPCWLIFDNFQEVTDDSQILKILIRALELLPPDFTITIASRNDLPASLVRFRANRKLSLIDWNQLAFNRDESAELIKLSGLPLSFSEAEKIFQYTQGWVAGTLLWLMQSVNDTMFQNRFTEDAPSSIFDYFASEVLEKADPVLRQFLLQTAVLPYMTIEIVERLTEHTAGQIFEELERRNYFLQKRYGPTRIYQYHPLFHNFLQARAARTFSPEKLKDLCSRAADILVGIGEIEEGIALYIQAKEYEPLAGIIAANAHVLLSQGRHVVLLAWIDALPDKVVNDSPWLLFWKGVTETPIDPLMAQAICIKAYKRFKQIGDLPGQIASWSVIVESYLYLRATFVPLDLWIAEGEKLGKAIIDKVDADTLGRFSSSMLFALLFRQPGHQDFSLWQEQCEKLVAQCRDEQVLLSLRNVLCFCYFWLGQTRRGEVFLSSDPLEGSGTATPCTRIYSNLFHCIYLLSTGRFSECRIAAEKTLAFGQEVGIHVHDLLFLSYVAYSCMLQDDFGTAHFYLKKMKNALVPHAVWDWAQYHFILAWLAILEGDSTAAKVQSDICTKQTVSCGNPYTMAVARILESQILLEDGDPGQAKTVLEKSHQGQANPHSWQIDFAVNLVAADCAYAENRLNDARRHLVEAFSDATAKGLVIPSGLSRKRLAVLCAKALEENIEADTVIEFIKLCRFLPPAAAGVGEEWPWPVQIYTLGRFDIQLFGTPLPLSAKTPKKQLELLRLLICTNKYKRSRTGVADRLWPEVDGDRTIQNFNTTLHRLRKLLGRDDVVILEKGRVYLNPEMCWVDSWFFEETVKLVDTEASWSLRERRITKAIGLYQGDFDKGQSFLPIITGYSEQLRTQWARLLGDFAKELANRKRNNDALKILEQGLLKDHHIEYFHQILITILTSQGRTNEAQAAFDRCCRALAELGMVPGEKTIAISNEIRKK